MDFIAAMLTKTQERLKVADFSDPLRQNVAEIPVIAAGQKPKITAFIVERGMGVKNGPPEHKLGIRGSSTTEVFFEDVRVPSKSILGDVGRGFKVAMEVLNSGRLGLAAGSVGGAKRLIKMAVDRVQERKAFGRPIGEFGLIKDKIAVMMADTFAMESMTLLVASMVDKDKKADIRLEAAKAKYGGLVNRVPALPDSP